MSGILCHIKPLNVTHFGRRLYVFTRLTFSDFISLQVKVLHLRWAY